MWRRQFLNSLPLFIAVQPVQESRTLDELNSYVKLLRKKEDLYFRLCDVANRTDEQIDVQIHLGMLKKEAERLREDELALLRNLESNEAPPKDNKRYLLSNSSTMYSLLSRIL